MENHWKLFPAIWRDGHKPLVAWNTESSADPDIHKQWLAGTPVAFPEWAYKGISNGSIKPEEIYLCVACKLSNVTILDVDNKHDKEGSATLVGLELEYGDLPLTLRVNTPSGGEHYYFKGAVAASVGKLGPGLDTPVMAPVPGSLVTGKGGYEVIQNAAIAETPTWLSDLVGAPRERDEAQHIPAIPQDQPHHVAEATAMLQALPVALEGEGGDTHTYKTACLVRDLAISEPVCVDLMLRYWNPRCQPPWDSQELSTKVKNAYNYALTQSGANTPEADFDVVSPFYSDDDGPKHIRDYEGDPVPREWIIEDWLPAHEITSLYGPGGGGKSLIAFQLALAVANGGTWFDMKAQDPMPVLMVACEDSDEEIHRRLGDIRQSAQYAFIKYDAEMYPWSRAGKDAVLARADRNRLQPGAFYGRLEAALAKLAPGPKLLLLDTIADIYAGNENDRAMVNYFVKVVLGGLIKKHDCTILVLGHPAKAAESEYSGSTAWNNAVRTRLTLTYHDNKNLKNHRILTRSKANYAAVGEALVLEWRQGRYERIDEEGIIDEVGELNREILLRLITEQAEKKVPFGIHNANRLCIYGVDITDSDGKVMGREVIKKILNVLLMEGLVEIISGDKDRNGIWPSYNGK